MGRPLGGPPDPSQNFWRASRTLPYLREDIPTPLDFRRFGRHPGRLPGGAVGDRTSSRRFGWGLEALLEVRAELAGHL